MTQCTHGSARGASGSSQMRANCFVPFGKPDQERGGERSSPSSVCCLGIASPDLNDALFTVIDMGASPCGPANEVSTRGGLAGSAHPAASSISNQTHCRFMDGLL